MSHPRASGACQIHENHGFCRCHAGNRAVCGLLSIANHVNHSWHASGRSRPSCTLWPIRKTPPELPDSPPQSRRGRSSMPSGWGHGGQIQGSETWGMPLGTSFPSQSSIHLRVVTASGQPANRSCRYKTRGL